MRVQAVMLDLDGTVTEGGGEKGKSRFFENARRYGAVIEERHRALVREYWGATAGELFRLCWPEGNFEEFISLWVKRDAEEPVPLIPGALHALKMLRAERILLGVLSNRDALSADLVLKAHHIRRFFDFFYAADSDALPLGAKKNPESVPVVLRGLKEKGIQKENTVFVGDSKVDHIWARWAGISFIGVCTGDLTRHEFLNIGVPEPLVLDSIASLPELLHFLE